MREVTMKTRMASTGRGFLLRLSSGSGHHSCVCDDGAGWRAEVCRGNQLLRSHDDRDKH